MTTTTTLPNKVDSYLRRAGLDERLIASVPEKVPDHAKPVFSKFLTQITASDPKGLYLFGDVGTGKSSAAACLARRIVERALTVPIDEETGVKPFHPEDVRWWTVSDLMVRIQNPYERETWLKRTIGAKFLFLDDFGTAATTLDQEQWLDQIVDGRYRKRKLTVVTTNGSLKDIQRKNPRLEDRWRQTMVLVPFSGSTRR